MHFYVAFMSLFSASNGLTRGNAAAWLVLTTIPVIVVEVLDMVRMKASLDVTHLLRFRLL